MAAFHSCEPERGKRVAGAGAIAMHTDRDLLVRALADAVPGRVLHEHACPASQLGRARVGRQQPCGELRDRRLPRAVRAGKGDDLATTQLEVDIVDDRKPGAVGELHAVEAAHPLRRRCGPTVRGGTEPDRPVLSQPVFCNRHRGVEQDSPSVQEKDAVRMLEDPPWAVVGNKDRDAEARHVLEECVGGAGIELRCRLVEQQQLRPQRDGGREADTLQFASRELGDGAIGEVFGSNRGERLVRASHDVLWSRPDILEPESNLADHAREDDLFFGILEDARHRPGELGRPH